MIKSVFFGIHNTEWKILSQTYSYRWLNISVAAEENGKAHNPVDYIVHTIL